MNFICEPCKNAGDYPFGPPDVVILWKRAFHNKCKGITWCDCQHRIGKKNV